MGSLFCLLDDLGMAVSVCNVSIWISFLILFDWSGGDSDAMWISESWFICISSFHFKAIFGASLALFIIAY